MKMKPVDGNSITDNEQGPKLKVDDHVRVSKYKTHVRVSKYKNSFAKRYVLRKRFAKSKLKRV